MSNALLEEPDVAPPDIVPPEDGGGGGGDGDGDDDFDRVPRRGGDVIPFSASRIATLFVLAMALMLFAGFISSYIILGHGSSSSWPPPDFPPLPKAFWVSSVLIAVSSLSGTLGSRRLGRHGGRRAFPWFAGTTILGLLFCASQLQGWSEIWRALKGPSSLGNYAGNFFAITGLHGVHVMGGLFWLSLVTLRTRQKVDLRRLRESAGNCMIYWHTVGALWFVLLYVLLR